MSSTMQAWRTGTNLTQAQMSATMINFFSDTLANYWKDIDTGTPGQVDYYISKPTTNKPNDPNIYIRVAATKMSVWGIDEKGNTTFQNSGNNFTVYKSGDCLVICIGTSSSYSKTAKYIIDTTDEKAGRMIIFGTTNSYCQIFDSSGSTMQNVYSPYTGTYSLNSSATLAQIAPFKIGLLDKSADTLYGVLLTPKMNEFLGIGNQVWLFTNGFAIPAGGSAPVPAAIPTVSS